MAAHFASTGSHCSIENPRLEETVLREKSGPLGRSERSQLECCHIHPDCVNTAPSARPKKSSEKIVGPNCPNGSENQKAELKFPTGSWAMSKLKSIGIGFRVRWSISVAGEQFELGGKCDKDESVIDRSPCDGQIMPLCCQDGGWALSLAVAGSMRAPEFERKSRGTDPVGVPDPISRAFKSLPDSTRYSW